MDGVSQGLLGAGGCGILREAGRVQHWGGGIAQRLLSSHQHCSFSDLGGMVRAECNKAECIWPASLLPSIGRKDEKVGICICRMRPCLSQKSAGGSVLGTWLRPRLLSSNNSRDTCSSNKQQCKKDLLRLHSRERATLLNNSPKWCHWQCPTLR